MRRLFTCTLALAAVIASPALADDNAEHVPTLTVSGTAVITAAPDQATIRLAVISEGEDAREVARDNARLTKAVIRALESAGANEDDIDTASFSVEPMYDYNRRREGKPPTIIGYRISNEVLLTTPDLDKTGELIGAGIEAGANKVNSLRFTLRDNTAQRAEAIANATAAARADARALSEAAGITLGGVHRIDLIPTNVQPIQRQFQRGLAMAMESAAPPINPGDVEVRAQVKIVYRISD